MKELFNTIWTLVIAFSLGFTATSCSHEDNDRHDERRVLYQYLNAAEEREDVTPEERQEYAFYAWRMERKNVAGLPKNFRTCQSDFKECDAHNGFDPDYVPSRKGLNELKVSASSDFSDAELDALVTEIRKLHDGPITVIDLRKESHGAARLSVYSRKPAQRFPAYLEAMENVTQVMGMMLYKAV